MIRVIRRDKGDKKIRMIRGDKGDGDDKGDKEKSVYSSPWTPPVYSRSMKSIKKRRHKI